MVILNSFNSANLSLFTGRRRRGQQKMRWLDGIMVNGYELGQTPGDGERQGGLVCCSPWDCEESIKHNVSDWTTTFRHNLKLGFPAGSVVKNLPANAGDSDWILWLGRCSGEGNDNLLQSSCLGNPMDNGALWATVHGVAKESDRTQQLNNKKVKFQCKL